MNEREEAAKMLRKLAWDVANGLDYGHKSTTVHHTDVLADGCLRLHANDGYSYDVVITKAGITPQYERVEKVRRTVMFAFTCLSLALGGMFVW